MKKFISVMLCLCICLSSTVFCFADFTSTDSSNLSDIKSRINQIWNAMPTYTQINGISSSLTTINNTLSTIASRLTDGNHSITYYVDAILSWMNPIYLRLQDILQAATDPAVNAITGLLGYPTTDSSTGVTSYTSYLRELYLLDKFNGGSDIGASIQLYTPLANGQYSQFGYSGFYNWRYTIIGCLSNISQAVVQSYAFATQALSNGYSTIQTYTSWTDLNSATFIPVSSTNGIYKWLSLIQNPVARLSYVLASDERIEAQEAAAENEEAVVDNFIDSSGSGAASPSDISSVSGLSSGFKDNISTDASVSGIWNIFNSDNFGWFSQETADQLDTTGSNTRTLRSSGSYPTPLLDQQTEDILKYIGGDEID